MLFTECHILLDSVNITPYSKDYKTIKDVPIVNASTAYTNESTGETLVLRFNQELWYGRNRLGMSLINPNQIQHYGLTVLDDPTDKNREFGITGEDFVVPFDILGMTVFFKSRAPTRWEMENCRLVELTCDSPWNPTDVNIAATTIAKPSSLTAIEIRVPESMCP